MSDNAAGVPANDGIEIVTNLPAEPANDSAPEQEKPVEPVEPDDEGEQTSDQSSEKKKNGWARQRDRLRNENEQYKARIAELERLVGVKPDQQAPKQETKPAGDDPEPKIEDFKDVLDYMRATQKWEARQAVKAADASRKEAENATKEQQAFEKKVGTYREQADAMLEQVPDFYERVDELIADGQITKPMQDAVLDSPMSAAVTLHLMTNPGDLQKMQSMNESQAYKAVGLIEAYIQNSSSAKPSEPTVAKPTRAAAPIPPTGKNAATATKPVEQMSQEEYDAHRLKVRRV